MAKKTKTFSLEEDIIKAIVNYKIENNLSSDSAALERIILQLGNNTPVINKTNIDANGLEKLIVKVLEKLDVVGSVINTKKITESKEPATELKNEGYHIENTSIGDVAGEMMNGLLNDD